MCKTPCGSLSLGNRSTQLSINGESTGKLEYWSIGHQMDDNLTNQAQLNHAQCPAVVGLPYLKEVLDFLRDWEDKKTKCQP